MKPMILSELLLWRQSLVKFSLIYMVFGVFFGVMYGNPWTAFAMVFCMMALGFVVGGPANDEVSDWQIGRLCMGMSRKQVVSGRYAAMLLFSLFSLVLALVGTVLCVVLLQLGVGGEGIAAAPEEGGFLQGLMLAVSICVLAVFLVSSVVYPLAFKLGNKRALRLIPIVCCAVALVAFLTVMDSPLVLNWLSGIIESNAGLLSLGVVAVSAVVLFISCKISQAIYAKREF